MISPLPKAVLFDFDGVIVETEWVIYESWQNFYLLEEQHLPLETYVQCVGSDLNTWSPETYLESLTEKSYDWTQIGAERQVEIETNLAHAPLIDGVMEMLDLLEKYNIAKAVVSSSSHQWVDRWLHKLGIFERFNEVVCRGDAPRIKPAPDLYIEASRRLSISPEDCLVIEDSRNGMLAGKAAGMPVLVIPSKVTSCLDFSEADYRVESMLECFEKWPTKL